MDANYWLGVVGSRTRMISFEKECWWCLMLAKAKKGDKIFMYLPRSKSVASQGIFMLCEVISQPDVKHKENWQCSFYGHGRGGASAIGLKHNGLGYFSLKPIERFKNHLSAAEMKRDPLLSTLGVVRRNFQGTTFMLEKEYYDEILRILREKNEYSNK